MLFFERQIDVQNVSPKEIDQVFADMIKTVVKVYKQLKDDDEYAIKQIMPIIFNMISTFVTNCPKISSNLMKQLMIL